MNIAWILVALVGGIALGWLGGHLVSAARQASASERARADSAQAGSEAAAARAEAAQARAESSKLETAVERARLEVAEARRAGAEVEALLARQEALTSKVEVERDAALEQALELRRDREAMLNSYKSLSADALDRQTKTVEESATKRAEATEQLMAPMRASLEKLETRLIEIEKQRAGLAAEMTSQVRSVQMTGEQLRKETSALVTALRKPTVRGAWGEVQLKRVVEMAGMVDHCDFYTQATTEVDDRTIRPDLKVQLAGGKFIFVDAKTPMEGFLDAEMAESDQDRAQFLAVFARRVRAHIDQLGSKAYWKADVGTPQFVILFLPSEALLSVALDQAPDLIEHGASKNVILATPTTLIAVLRAISYAWTQEVLAESAKQVSQLGRELYDRLGKMGSHFDRLGRALESSVKSYNDAIGSLESRVMVSARRFQDLGVSDDDLDDLTPITTGTRSIAAPELVASATEVPALIGRERLFAPSPAEAHPAPQAVG